LKGAAWLAALPEHSRAGVCKKFTVILRVETRCALIRRLTAL